MPTIDFPTTWATEHWVQMTEQDLRHKAKISLTNVRQLSGRLNERHVWFQRLPVAAANDSPESWHRW